MTTLFEATFRLAGFLSTLWESTATGGSVTSLVDTLATFGDQHVGGTLWIKAGDLIGKTLVPTSRTGTTQLNFATQTPNDIAAGNGYILVDSDFNRGILRRAVNEALREYSKRRAEDETLLTVADQDDYTLPAGVQDVKEVWLAANTSAPYDFYQLFHWDEVDGELRFPTGFAPESDDYPLRIVYRDVHDDLEADADELPVDVNHELIHWAACAWAVENSGLPRFHGDPKRDMANKATKADAELQACKRNWRAWQRSTRAADY